MKMEATMAKERIDMVETVRFYQHQLLRETFLNPFYTRKELFVRKRDI